MPGTKGSPLVKLATRLTRSLELLEQTRSAALMPVLPGILTQRRRALSALRLRLGWSQIRAAELTRPPFGRAPEASDAALLAGERALLEAYDLALADADPAEHPALARQRAEVEAGLVAMVFALQSDAKPD
jgi:hypothetical protein